MGDSPNIPLVSIITPCYNGEKFVHRFLDSVLDQTHDNIELIFVNDGSTDRTEEIVQGYKNKFNEKGIKFIYIYQENKGLPGAINTGLKVANGEYICWPDSDDYLEASSIEKRVKVLEANLELGSVTTDAYLYNEEDLVNPIGKVADHLKNKFDPNQFLYLLEEKSTFCPGCHMVRKSALIDVNPKLEIYAKARGQNFQLLLPLYYKYKRGYIDEPLYNYIIYKNSMSRGDDSLDKTLFRNDEHKNIVLNTLETMKINEKERKLYTELVITRYLKKDFYAAIQYNDKKMAENLYKNLKKQDCLKMKDTAKLLFCKYTFLQPVLKIIKKLKKTLIL